MHGCTHLSRFALVSRAFPSRNAKKYTGCCIIACVPMWRRVQDSRAFLFRLRGCGKEIKGFASVCTGSCTGHRPVRLHIRIPHLFMRKDAGKSRRLFSCVIFTRKMPSPNRSPAKRVRFGEGRRTQRICSFRGSFANRGNGMELSPSDVAEGAGFEPAWTSLP